MPPCVWGHRVPPAPHSAWGRRCPDTLQAPGMSQANHFSLSYSDVIFFQQQEILIPE